MRSIVRILSAAVMAMALPLAMMAQDRKMVHTDASELSVCGKVCDITYEQYSRLPASLEGVTGNAIWRLGRNSAGIYVRFRSDAGAFEFKWGSVFGSFLDNVSLIATRGMALYVRDGKEWMYVGTARPDMKGLENRFTVKCADLEGTYHEYMLYLSLYDGVRDLSIGVPEGCHVLKPELPLPADDRPVILYGTSLTQGASASHPGMAGSNQLSRMLDRTVVNLGFSGNGKLDPEIASLIAAYPDPAAYVIDNWNGNADLGEARLEDFIATIRKAHPKTPILLIGRAMAPGCLYNAAEMKIWVEREKTIEEKYRKLKKAGDRNLYHLRLSVLGPCNSSTIDGGHFTDEAFRIWAEETYSILKKVCR